MKENPNKKEAAKTHYYYAGSGLAIGAGIGSIFGMLLFENLAMGAGFGAAMGLIIGAVIDSQRQAEQNPDR
jgi:uncharacterized membrane protein